MKPVAKRASQPDIVWSAKELAERLAKWTGRTVTFDFETTGLDPFKAEILGVAIALSEDGQPGINMTVDTTRAAGRKLSIKFWDKTTDVFYIPVNHEEPIPNLLGEQNWTDYKQPWRRIEKQMTWRQCRNALNKIFNDPTKRIVAHNTRFDVVFGWVNGLKISGRLEDTLLMSAVLWPTYSGGHGLKNLAVKQLGVTPSHVVDFKDQCLIEWVSSPEVVDEAGDVTKRAKWGSFKADFARLPLLDFHDPVMHGYGKRTVYIPGFAVYATNDALFTSRLFWQLDTILETWRDGRYGKSNEEWAYKVYNDIEQPLIDITSRMTFQGTPINVPWVVDYNQRLLEEMATTKAMFEKKTKGALISSTHALNDVLETLMVKEGQSLADHSTKGKSGRYSVAAGIMDLLIESADVPESVKELARLVSIYRKLQKVQSNYTTGWLRLVDKHGKLHPTFDQRGTVTGRFSSYNPNLQNVPRGETLGNNMREAIKAPRGWKMVAIDYSQIELRMMAHMSRDVAMREAFLRGLDIHSATAASIHQKPIEDVTKKERQLAKSVNFATIYGGGVGVIRRSTGAEWGVCQAYYDGFMTTYSGVKAWMDKTFADFEQRYKDGKGAYIETYYGRRRYVSMTSEEAFTVVVNTPIQGTAADLIKKAMILCSGWIDYHGSRAQMIMQVHDELVFLVPDDEFDTVVPAMAHIMETVDQFDIPILVDIEFGQNWYDLKEWDGYEHEKYLPDTLEELI